MNVNIHFRPRLHLIFVFAIKKKPQDSYLILPVRVSYPLSHVALFDYSLSEPCEHCQGVACQPLELHLPLSSRGFPYVTHNRGIKSPHDRMSMVNIATTDTEDGHGVQHPTLRTYHILMPPQQSNHELCQNHRDCMTSFSHLLNLFQNQVR